MINRSKMRFIAYAFLTFSIVLVFIGYVVAQKEHSENNWYVNVNPGDKEKLYTLHPNIPYTFKTDNYISHITFFKNNYGTEEIFKMTFDDASGRWESSRGNYAIGHFNITCSDTFYFKIGIYLSGVYVKDGYYEVHRGLAEGRDLFFNGKTISRHKDF